MILTNEIRTELLASGWAEPVTDPVRLDTLAYIARNQHVELVVALPYGQPYTANPADRHERIRWESVFTPEPRALSSDLTQWAAEQGGPVRCWTT